MSTIKSHNELIVFQRAVDASVKVFATCRELPNDERFDLCAQWRRCSRSVAANLAEAWRKRYYRPHFLSKLTDVEAEAAECQVWAVLSFRYGYIGEALSQEIQGDYEEIIKMTVSMSANANHWVIRRR